MTGKNDLLFSGVLLTALAIIMMIFMAVYHRNGGAALVADQARIEAFLPSR